MRPLILSYATEYTVSCNRLQVLPMPEKAFQRQIIMPIVMHACLMSCKSESSHLRLEVPDHDTAVIGPRYHLSHVAVEAD